MSQEITFLPYEKAKQIVGNVIEEEHLHEANRRILTAYDLQGRELCWFDAEEVLTEVRSGEKKRVGNNESDEVKMAAVEYVLHRIPEWVLQNQE